MVHQKAKRIFLSFVAFAFERVRCVSPSLIVKCSSSSIFALALDYAILFVLVQFINVWYLYASAISFLFAHTLEYCINRNYIFKVKDVRIWRYVKFLILEIIGLLLLLIGMKIMVDGLQVDYLVSRGIAAVGLGIFYFTMNTFYTFRD